ncbi:hypothetical protein IFM89_017573 [Coptis chinensis]|uniref:X8 domain-containing protein n=1 Tax=Coptis chinensis TaxID=261450 RepID=A0A835HVL6_9MAGN|nr:hypothetical protein IFM89_017573 [Coptis chinensis]
MAVKLHSFSSGNEVSVPLLENIGKMTSLKFITKIRKLSNVNEHIPIPYPQVILCVQVYKMSKIWVLGSQMLSEWRDQIYCLTDHSGYFVIEDVFCNDKRDPSAIDYSDPIFEWLRKSKWECILSGELQQKQRALLAHATTPHLPQFKAVDMHKIRFCDLSFRVAIREIASGSDGKNYFAFVTNLAPCSGVRLHLWPEKSKMASDTSPSKGVVEVTSKMVEIPAGPAPIQIEPGSQTEQPPPSAVLQLGPEDMRGFHFLTISVSPRPTVSGRPPPAASMAVGQFFNPDDGKRKFSPASLLLSFYSEKVEFSRWSVSNLARVPHGLCRLRCFPPVAIAWYSTSGLHVIPNLYSETISVDSSPAFWDSTQESDMTTVLLLLDPHCSFTIGAGVSVTTAAGRFLLLYCSEIVGFSIAIIFFALMRQARTWELDLPLPSLLAAVELNLRMPLAFLLLAILPIVVSLVASLGRKCPTYFFQSVSQSFLQFLFTQVILVCFVHLALGMLILLLSHALHSHTALCSGFDPLLPLEEKSPNSPNFDKEATVTPKSKPSITGMRIGVGQSFPWFLDSALCVGVILHGLCGSKPKYNFISFPFLHIQGQQVGLSIVYMRAGFYWYLSGLALAPYRAFYAMAAVGVLRLDFGTGNSFFRFFGDTVILGGNVDITPAEARVSKPLKSLAHPKYISSSRSSITKSTYYLKKGRHLEMDPTTDFTNTQPYVSSPFTLPPFDSLAPLPLPQNTPYCENPPSIPQPPTQIPTPMIYTTPPPPPTTSYSAPIVPAQNPPPSPTFDVPSPPECSPSPNPPEYGPSPPSFSPETPGTLEYVPLRITMFQVHQRLYQAHLDMSPAHQFISRSRLVSHQVHQKLVPQDMYPAPQYTFQVHLGYTPSPVFQPPVIYPPPSVPPPPYKGPHYALWCVVKPSVPDPIIQEAMNYACGSGANCESIQPSGSCYQPDTLYAHTSYAFNSYWQRTKVAGGTCDFGSTGMLVTVDPSKLLTTNHKL